MLILWNVYFSIFLNLDSSIYYQACMYLLLISSAIWLAVFFPDVTSMRFLYVCSVNVMFSISIVAFTWLISYCCCGVNFIFVYTPFMIFVYKSTRVFVYVL